MSDTQLRRYEVFAIERPGRPPVHAGSVHAADDELALLNARDVFARRPECCGLWVLPAEGITTSLPDGGGAQAAGTEDTAATESYLAFGKAGHKGAYTYLGVIEAGSPQAALERTRAAYRQGIVDWWVAPERFRRATADEDRAAMFEPALSKPFRDQSFYPVETLMRRLRRRPRGGGRTG